MYALYNSSKKVSFGFAAGGSQFKGETINEYKRIDKDEQIQYTLPFGGGSGAGININPVAFLIVDDNCVKLMPINHSGALDKIVDFIPDIIEKVDENDELVYGDVNILSHLFSIDALETLAKTQLPYHIAEKKSDYLDENGNLVEPEDKNVYKFESFIFDAFSNFDDISILRVKREEEFAPIKNKEGNDSPETAVKLYNARN